MSRDPDDPRPLHTVADDDPPLSARESTVMGRQVAGHSARTSPGRETVYGETEDTREEQDQADAHHADPDQHL